MDLSEKMLLKKEEKKSEKEIYKLGPGSHVANDWHIPFRGRKRVIWGRGKLEE
jgi:hypothetical protein